MKAFLEDLIYKDPKDIRHYLENVHVPQFVQAVNQMKDKYEQQYIEGSLVQDSQQQTRTDIAVRLMERLMPSMDLTGMGDMATGLITKQIVKLTDSLLKELETTNLNKD